MFSVQISRTLVGLSAIAVSSSFALSPSLAVAADAEAGLAIANKWCNSCLPIGTDEPRQADAGPNFSELAGKDVDYLQGAINRPHDFMPNFPSLSDTAKPDVIAYIQTLK